MRNDAVGGAFAPLRFMLYSHDGFGLGHYRRNVVLARALSERMAGASVLLACSADGADAFALPPGVDMLRLPGVRKVGNGRYLPRRLRVDGEELLALRAHLLATAVSTFEPDVILVDKHALGVHGELVDALAAQRADGRRAALGLRDVLDDSRRVRAEWQDARLVEMAARFYDAVLVYGSADLLTPEAGLPDDLRVLVRHCGYVVESLASPSHPTDLPSERSFVLATAGGGEDGLPMLEAFVDAATDAAWDGVVVGGPQMAVGDWARLERKASRAGVAAFQSVPQVQRWYGHAAALVCMGGYNTILEAVTTPVPTVCVPRTRPRQEQLIRARAFAERGLLQVVELGALSPRRLAHAIAAAVETPRAELARRVESAIDVGGSRRAAQILLDLATTARSVDGTPVAVPA